MTRFHTLSKRTPFVVAALSICLILEWLAWWGWTPSTIPPGCVLRHNAAWESVDWISGQSGENEIIQLARLTSQRQIRYLYPYAAYLKADGQFSASASSSSEFINIFKQYNDETLLLAWIGVPLAKQSGPGINGWAELSEPETRQRIVDFSTALIQLGFDGVHLNVETVRDQDPHYLLLLEEVRQALGSEHILSLAGSAWLPDGINHLPWVNGYRWSDDYTRAVAMRADQVVIMLYDSALPHPVLYRLWLREQTNRAKANLKDLPTKLILGISVSKETSRTHRPQVENLSNGLAGICAALTNTHEKSSQPAGIAIYAAWETTEQEWTLWETWLNER